MQGLKISTFALACINLCWKFLPSKFFPKNDDDDDDDDDHDDEYEYE